MKKLPTLLSVFSLTFLTPSLAKTNTEVEIETETKEVKKSESPRVTNTEHGQASWYEIKCNGGTKNL